MRNTLQNGKNLKRNPETKITQEKNKIDIMQIGVGDRA